MRKSLYTQDIIWVYTILNHILGMKDLAYYIGMNGIENKTTKCRQIANLYPDGIRKGEKSEREREADLYMR
jgi:hypothetical protein